MDKLNKCHAVAAQILDFEKEYAEVNGQIVDGIDCIYYEQPGEEGHKLIVSIKDNSILWATPFMPLSTHLQAFKEGMRTDKKILKKLYNI